MAFLSPQYLTLLLLLITNVVKSITVRSKVGVIKGLRARDGNYSMYLGIPYAKVNESNPFGESLPYPHFETEFKAYDDTGICAQQEKIHNTIVGNLDCLHVNIYVPDFANKESKLPVLVYIYGGFLRFGFSGRFLYGPKFLIEHNIILVTFNFRVGPYGFFCLSIPEVSGNQGFKDQIKALRWINENIEAFGGDSTRITVDGSSSGAAGLDYIVHTLEDKKLFDKIILQSGNAYSVEIENRKPDDNVPVRLANQLGYNVSSLDEALRYLTLTDPSLVINASVSLDLKYHVCQENTFNDIAKVPTDNPINLKVPMVKDMPILMGNTDAETLYLIDSSLTSNDFKKIDIFKNRFLFEKNYMENMKNIVYRFYFDKENAKPEKEIMNFACDFYYYHPSKRILKKYLENGAHRIYYYLFTYDGGRNFIKRKNNITAPGANHADELGYLFDMSILNDSISENDAQMIKYMTTLWSNFVKYGNPTPEITDLLPVQWLTYNLNTQLYMDINLKFNLKAGLNSKRMAFWDLFYDINGKYQRGRNNQSDL